MTQTAEIVICGAGIAGIATAYYLAKNFDITDIALVDKHAPLSQTTAKSGENFRNWWPNRSMVDFSHRSIVLMMALADATDNIFHLQQLGYAYVSMTDASLTKLQTIEQRYQHPRIGDIRLHPPMNGTEGVAYRPNLGTGFDRDLNGADILLNPDLIRQHFPHLSSDVCIVTHVRQAGSISAQQLGMYMLQQVKDRGVRLIEGELIAVSQDAQGVDAVQVLTKQNSLQIQTRHFVNAAGPFINQIAGLLGIDLPIQTIFQQKIAMQDPLQIVPRDAPFTIFEDAQYLDWTQAERDFWQTDPQYRGLLAQYPGGLHIKPEGTGESPWLKLGWALNRQAEEPHWEPSGTPEFPEIVVRGASKFVPGLKQYLGNLPKPLVHYGGYYTRTQENLPMIGPLEVSGAYVVGALSGYGTMTGCAAGELCATWIVGQTLPPYAEYLSLARYQNDRYLAYLDELEVDGEL